MPDVPPDPRPHSRLTPRVRRDAFVDQAALRVVASMAGKSDPAVLERMGKEVPLAHDLFEARGWLQAPETYHETPPPPEGVRHRGRRSGNVRYTAMSWLDGYAPRLDEPGADRFDDRRNRVARAALLEHRGEDRPWLVCLHGFAMGQPTVDLRAFRALHLHRELGLNLAFLTLPFHGARNPKPRSTSPGMPSADVLHTVHGLTQAVWDARQLLAHLRQRTDQPIGLMGLSLGGLVAAVVASVDEPHAVVLLIPAVDLPSLMRDAAERIPSDLAADPELLEQAAAVFAPVSPLRLTPKVPVERRCIVAGTLDRFARPTTQATALWRHWDEPALHWYHGGHVSMFWARGMQDTIDAQLRTFGLAP